MTGFFDRWEDDISSDSDDDYDPYDDMKNGRIPKCKYGVFYGVAGYCCNKCHQEQKRKREALKKNYWNGVFETMFNNNEYVPEDLKETFKFDPLLEYYKILQLIPPQTREQVRKQYLKLSLKHHPDKNSDSIVSVKKFQEINEAYNKLIQKID